MSNINVGFVDGRMCSRILKPPGGGYSELFFTTEDTPKKAPPARSESVIESILRTEEPIESPKKTVTKTSMETIVREEVTSKTESKMEESQSQIQNQTKTENGFKEVHTEVKGESCLDGKVEETVIPTEKVEEKMQELKIKDQDEKKTAIASPQEQGGRRGRVPPGGFSSGLW